MFRICIQEDEDELAQEFRESSTKLVWDKIVDAIDSLRWQHELHSVRLIESLPEVEILHNYAFKYKRLQLLDMLLRLNTTACARSEPKLQTHF
ncbi:unnamed protein product [Rotaria sp. Silwood1]|nr:unnamed protein product [Rotaria sp. Silwood1]CAF3876338.1 unnamed protein product [Rotaria sp. Silwood1]CAF4631249.1 unnamed protein product [Rotaria sp. Silwood1]CAF4907958.1 unnamed protein product [Rotaria sp. Silwood1]CAF5021858.1 unnamed protein product [Rotaria sp. Silwood1]